MKSEFLEGPYMPQVDRMSEDESLSSNSIFAPNLTPPSRQLERTADNVLAKLRFVGPDKHKLEVEGLFKVIAEDHDEGGTLRLRLWRLWGDAEIGTETMLASCEYDPDTFEVPQNRIFFAYQALNSHCIHGQSYAVKAHSIDPTRLNPETHSLAPKPATAGLVLPQVKQFQGLMENLAPGHAILIRIRLENYKQFIDPEQVAVARSISAPISAGFGSFPDEGSHWGLVEKVTQEGQIEVAAEYKVLRSRPTSTKNNWRAQFEKTPSDRKLFSLIDFKRKS